MAMGADRPEPPQASLRPVPRVDLEAARAEYSTRRLTLAVQDASYWPARYQHGWGHASPMYTTRTVPWPVINGVNNARVAVLQSGRALTVPDLLATLGDRKGEQALRSKVNKNRSLSSAFKGMAAVGVVGLVVGLVGRGQAYDGPYSDWQEVRQWRTIAVGGAALAGGGLVLASFPGSRADRLELDPSLTLSADELMNGVRDHNAALAEDLGLDPELPIEPTAQEVRDR